MRPTFKPAAIVLILLLFAFAAKPAKADPLGDNIGAQVALSIVLLGAAAGVTIYFLVRKGPGITGCAVASANGLQLHDQVNNLDYNLSGDIAAIHPGEKVRVYGKKQTTASGEHQFLVRKQPKELGSCNATP